MARHVGHFRVVGRIGVDRGHVIVARQLHVVGTGEAFVARLHHVAQRQAIELVGQQGEEGLDVIGIEAAIRRQLPHDGAKLFAQFGNTAFQKMHHALGAVAQGLALSGKAVRLDGELKAVRRLIAPARVGGRLLRGVEGGVDLDAGQLPAGEVQLLRGGQTGRVEHTAAPFGEVPAADADADAGRVIRHVCYSINSFSRLIHKRWSLI